MSSQVAQKSRALPSLLQSCHRIYVYSVEGMSSVRLFNNVCIKDTGGVKPTAMQAVLHKTARSQGELSGANLMTLENNESSFSSHDPRKLDYAGQKLWPNSSEVNKEY
jgi:hypothetical protein